MTAGKLPDFYILGAMKAATTTLAAQLGAQGGIAMSREKEPDYFVDEEVFARGADWYAGLWSGAPKDALLGEASTSYTKWPDQPGVPGRVKTITPDAKFIYMIRHPIARARSHALHEIRKRRGEEINQIAHKLPGICDYGCYAKQLEQWLKHFRAEQFLIVAAERLQADPEAEFARVLDFLRVGGAWSEELARVHSAEEGYRTLPLEGRLQKLSFIRALRRHLIPKSVKRAFRKVRAIDTDQQFTDETRQLLGNKMAPDLVRLGRMCGTELSLETYQDVVLRQHLQLTSG